MARQRLAALNPKGSLKGIFDGVKAKAPLQLAGKGPTEVKADTSILDSAFTQKRQADLNNRNAVLSDARKLQASGVESRRRDKSLKASDERKHNLSMALKEYESKLAKERMKYEYDELGGKQKMEFEKSKVRLLTVQTMMYVNDRITDVLKAQGDLESTQAYARAAEDVEDQIARLETSISNYVSQSAWADATSVGKKATEEHFGGPEQVAKATPSEITQFLNGSGARHTQKARESAFVQERLKVVNNLNGKLPDFKAKSMSPERYRELFTQFNMSLNDLRRVATNDATKVEVDNAVGKAPAGGSLPPAPPPTTAPPPAGNPVGEEEEEPALNQVEPEAETPLGATKPPIDRKDGIITTEAREKKKAMKAKDDSRGVPTMRGDSFYGSRPPIKNRDAYAEHLRNHTSRVVNSLSTQEQEYQDLVKKAERYGIPFSNHSSSISREEAERLIEEIESQPALGQGVPPPSLRDRPASPMEAQAVPAQSAPVSPPMPPPMTPAEEREADMARGANATPLPPEQRMPRPAPREEINNREAYAAQLANAPQKVLANQDKAFSPMEAIANATAPISEFLAEQYPEESGSSMKRENTIDRLVDFYIKNGKKPEEILREFESRYRHPAPMDTEITKGDLIRIKTKLGL